MPPWRAPARSGWGRPPHPHLDTALALLDVHGPAAPTHLFTMASAAAAARVHRSTLYRYWETSEAMDGDLARWLGTSSTGWLARLVRCDPVTGLAAAVRAALGGAGSLAGVGVRAAVSSAPPSSPVRGDLVAWERRALHALAAWLEAHLDAHGRRVGAGVEALDVAVALVAVVEGALLIDGLRAGPGLERVPLDRIGTVAAGAAGVVASMSRAVPWVVVGGGGGWPDRTAEPVPGLAVLDDWSPAKRRLAVQLTRPERDGHAAGWVVPTPARLVDIALLSSSAGVSERRLYAIWPSVASFNAELVGVVLRRHAAEADEAVRRVFRGGGGLAATTSGRLVDACDAYVGGGLLHPRSSPFACTAAMAEPEVRTLAVAAVQQWHRGQVVNGLARLQVLGREVAPQLGPLALVDLALAAVVGGQRLAISHPDLGDRWVARQGRSCRSVALAPLHLVEAFTTDRGSGSGI